MKYIFLLGHQPHLSLAELESVYNAKNIIEYNNFYAVIELNEVPNIDELGGTTKISQIIKSEYLSEDIQTQLKNLILDFISEQKSTKLKLGLSIYSGKNDVHLSQKNVQKILEEVRREIKRVNPELNLRTVEPKSPILNTAQIIHSGLLKTNGISLDIIISSPTRHPRAGQDLIDSTVKNRVTLAQTIQVPNLRKYTLRDYSKPKPSGKNGMLPPKLAQILINLSGAKAGDTILDPFCGSGTVLQEAILQNINCIGTDLNPNIIDDAKENLEWLENKFKIKESGVKFKLSVADSTSHKWSDNFDHVVCESYLGTPMTNIPTDTKLNKIIEECNALAEEFLKNIHSQLTEESTLVYALPCWFIENKIIKLPVVENLSALGYNKVKSKKINQDGNTDLIYRRTSEDESQKRSQIVGRDIYVLKKK
ncbi:MAG: methyltransferase domain-containing protein [Candidatus Nomurabacteria bacterium]|nr:MAG: methyltransferase domain-containing protein [Candidatus Nomurabacteria bacterium]